MLDRVRASTDQAFYDEAPVDAPLIAEWAEWMPGIMACWLPELRAKAEREGPLKILELGSGTCLLAALLARESFVEHVTCTDISVARMREAMRSTSQVVSFDESKVDYGLLNFNEAFPIEDNAFDAVVCHGSLHHSRSMWATLHEVNRVLRSGGVFVAQRERILAPLTGHLVTRRMLTDPEFAAGVSENSYTLGQYEYYLRIAGFDFRAIPASGEGRAVRLLSALNGVLFSKYVLWSEKTGEPRYSA